MQLSPQSVRTAMLAVQGLLTPPTDNPSREDVLHAIQRMGYLQIDTIQAVRRSQSLVLWTRLGDYEVDWLYQLHAEGHLFEYYAHALCYLPLAAYPIFRGLMLNGDHRGGYWSEWLGDRPEVVRHVRAAVRENGPLSSMDFDTERIETGWGGAKAEKIALNHLFVQGEFMVAHRDNFRRFYDLRERVYPDWDDANALAGDAAREALTLETVRALGAVREDWVADYYYQPKTDTRERLQSLAEAGQLIRAEVPGWDLPVYIHPDNLDMVQSAADGALTPTYTTLLSPFDPLVSDRARALDLFNFDYRMESYTPVKDRKYGYFCLPILHNGQLVGRLDPKAHRKKKRMEIKKIYLEPEVQLTDDLVEALGETLARFTAWHEMDELIITDADRPELLEALR
jgi:hypothetical protein